MSWFLKSPPQCCIFIYRIFTSYCCPVVWLVLLCYDHCCEVVCVCVALSRVLCNKSRVLMCFQDGYFCGVFYFYFYFFCRNGGVFCVVVFLMHCFFECVWLWLKVMWRHYNYFISCVCVCVCVCVGLKQQHCIIILYYVEVMTLYYQEYSVEDLYCIVLVVFISLFCISIIIYTFIHSFHHSFHTQSQACIASPSIHFHSLLY